ncbi:MAG: Aldehyde dehydrogenase [uncultured Solirubrobacteraceae bacterium]|uniref:Aldehyde dehydrogenase n=1 Tax=uncultured Solirubrobacteraceae bacterium TaxID=1162706 RepID=A0A6J4T5P8_9ACTN|nr:MAG: Aldehyde dehydrogenase [uncultured Solirubrobacteraceae bacterium]
MLESIEPATGRPLGSVAITPPEDVERVVAGSAAVQPLWAQLRLADRARYMNRAAQALIDEFAELVELVSREQGRPRAEAELMEVLPAIETLRWLAEAGPAILGDDKVGLSRTFFVRKRARVTHQPVGVVGVISSGAEPLANPLGDVAIALFAGNGVVLKPAPTAPLSGERIGRAFARAGLPEGLLRIIHGGSATGQALVASAVDQVRLTGSAEVGREVGEACARALKPATLSLAGKDPAIVLADAPLDRSVRGIVWGAFANAGQAGGSIERAYVDRTVHDRFLAAVVSRARSLTVGDPLADTTEIGPLTTPERVERVRALVDDAVSRGARLHCGGPREGSWFAPAVLTGVPEDAPLLLEEVPGPVLAIVAVDGVDAAVTAANRGEFGLGASIWTEDRAHGSRIARALDSGMVWLNDHQVAAMAPQMPWGGVKDSGLGRMRGEAALRECVSDKVVTWDPPAGRQFWWHPYDRSLVRTGEALAWLRSVRDRDRARAWRTSMPAVARVVARTLVRSRRG